MEKRILIADDDSRVLEALSRWFDRFPEFGRVLVAKDGREAVDKTQRYNPSLVILDLSMPGMNGIEAARWVHKARPDVPIILFTFHGAEFNSLVNAGISAVVSKDQVETQLLGKVRELLNPPYETPASAA